MRHVDMKRKYPTPWPWLAGLGVLALIIWGVTSLLAAPNEEDPAIEAAGAAEHDVVPALIPRPPHPVGSSTVQARDVRDLYPLELDDAGTLARAEGEVLATGSEGFWILAGSEVIRVDSRRPVRRGQVIEVEGVLQETSAEPTDRIADEVLSRSGASGVWTVARTIKLVERDDARPTEPDDAHMAGQGEADPS
jgi:hypothetical protein